VATTLAGTQMLICLATIGVANAGTGWVLLAAGASVAFGAILIWQLESSPVFRADLIPADAGSAGSAVDEASSPRPRPEQVFASVGGPTGDGV
jgi:hypothetical protein